MSVENDILPAAAASPQPCEMSDDEKIDAYVELSNAAMKERFASADFRRRVDEAAQADGFVPPGFDLDAYCGYDSAIVASRDSELSISREKAAERERCARIADAGCDSCPCGCGGEIAARIRSGE